MAKNKGISGLITFCMEVFATPTPTKRTLPTGGVHKPIHKFKIMMIPSKFLNLPADKKLIDMEITVRKRAYAGGADQIDEKLKMKAGCQ